MKEKVINIGKRRIGPGEPVFLIAEAGVNHNGDIKLAKKMIDASKECGADAVKFQTFIAEEVMTDYAPKAKYQKRTTGGNGSQLEMAKKFELPLSDFKKLKDYAESKNIIFLSTPFDPISAEYLNKIGVLAFKISSGDLTNIPLLSQIAKYNRPMIISTGMAELAEIRAAMQTVYSKNNRQIILMHCTSNYPTKYQNVNLKAMITLSKETNLPVGYSDHTEGIEVASAAVAMGACVIEKHFTLDKGLPGPDHKASIEPNELKLMVRSIRNIESALGTAAKRPIKSEIEVRKVARKSIVAAVDIPKGARISGKMLAMKRPGNGISPRYLREIIGKVARKDIKKDLLLNKKRDLI